MGTNKHMEFGPYRGIGVNDYSHFQNIIGNELIGAETAITYDGNAEDSQGTSTGLVVHGNNIHGRFPGIRLSGTIHYRIRSISKLNLIFSET